MSDKWRRAKAWDDAFFPAWAWPAKFALRALSSVTLAVILLVLVSIYGTLASIPIGLIALVPTKLFYAVTILGVALLLVGVPLWVALRVMRERSRAAKFAVGVIGVIALLPFAVATWYTQLWPLLHYDPATGGGVRFFSSFVEAYQSTTLRRLPGIEMSELEFYDWWPLRVILLLFVVNLVVATVRRIEFNFKNIGVLMVHSGIIVIALGSVYYNGLKQEGDTLLLAGQRDASGKPTLGPPQTVFYDNTEVTLYVDQFRGWEQRPLYGVPRYNDYNLGAIEGESAWEISGRRRPWEGLEDRELDLEVMGTTLGRVDDDIRFRVVGYAAYAEPAQDWVRRDPSQRRVFRAEATLNPLRILHMYSALPDDEGRVSSEDPVFVFTLPPMSTQERWTGNQVFAVEYTKGEAAGMSEDRWRDLSEQVPAGTADALVIDIPAANGRPAHRGVYPISKGTEIRAGETGYVIEVQDIAPEPPFPIITEGFRGASSSVAIVKVTPPEGPAFERYVYHRFPQIAQDMLTGEVNERGMPSRRDADSGIRITYIECDRLNVYLDEGPTGQLRAIVREPGGVVRVKDSVDAAGGRIDVVPGKLWLTVAAKWEDAVRVERPNPIPRDDQDPERVGRHEKGMLAVEVSTVLRPSGDAPATPWRTIVWLPFTQYMGVGMGTERRVELADGRVLNLAFGRLQHRLPGFAIQLVEFQMIAYDHRGAPRDFQSVVRVTPTTDPAPLTDFEPFEHVTKLNAPLMAPFNWDVRRGAVRNLLGRLASGVNPHQYKFSQAGWDAGGWEETQAQADAGLIPEPFAKFTILGVGNNPGIHVIAFGSVLMGVGIPWAFYFKPYLVRREKKKIQEALKAGTYVPPGRAKSTAGATSGPASGAGLASGVSGERGASAVGASS